MTRICITALGIILLLAVAVPSFAGNACVIVSKRLPPYLEAYEGIKEVLSKDVKRFDLDGNRAKGVEVVRRMRNDGCAVIIPVGTLALDIARLQIRNLPIVYTMVASPPPSVRNAENMIGLTIEPAVSNLFEALTRIVPNAKTVGAIYNPSYTASYMNSAQSAARATGLALESRPATNMKEIAGALDFLLPRIDALLMVPDPTTSHQKAFELMLLESVRRGVPIIGVSAKHVKAGALFSLSKDYRNIGLRTGFLARQVMEGMSPKHATPTRSRGVLVINVKTAQRLGIHITPSIIQGAGKVYP